ncbi:HET-domain-containing protein [Xylariaceae sp. FL0594]|nr:HET-domain-containing protein [Xylariaceae sp. FL0594]
MSIPYSQLDSLRQEIRLLQILPVSGPKYARIPRCQLVEVSLSDRPHYSVLSYTAERDTTKNRVIVVNNIPIRVPENLYDAVMTLRPADDNPSTVWVDYICINQGDKVEKSSQVGLLKDIFSQAREVLAWLGPGDPEVDPVIEFLDSFGRDAQACGFHKDPGVADTIWERLASSDLLNFKGSQEILSGILSLESNIFKLIDLFNSISGWHSTNNLFPVTGMEKLFGCEYWDRVWVLQEITVSAKVEFLSGSKRISRTRLMLAEKHRANECGSFKEYHYRIVQKSFHARPTIIINARRSYLEGRFPLMDLLRLACKMEATTDREELERHGEVYTLVTAALLQQGHVSAYLPSWVPDWSKPTNETLQTSRDSSRPSEYQFCVSGDSIPPSNAVASNRLNLANGSFRLEGHVYDQVLEVGRFSPKGNQNGVPLAETASWLPEWLGQLFRLTYDAARVFPRFDDRLRAVVRSAVAGTIFTGRSGDLSRVGDAQFDEASFLLQYTIDNAQGNKLEAEHEAEVRAFLARADVQEKLKLVDRDSLELLEEITAKSSGRLPFLTGKGHLGLSRENIHKGDCITIFQGAQVPYLLRPQADGTYQLISEAYVDGIMDGEMAMGIHYTRINLV